MAVLEVHPHSRNAGRCTDERQHAGQTGSCAHPRLRVDPLAELDDALRTVWKRPKGGFLRVDATGIDAGGGVMMDRVLGFCRPRMARRMYAVKGASVDRQAIKASDTRGARLFIVGVDGLNGQLINRLTRIRSVRFSDMLEGRFYEELASEWLVVHRKFAPIRQWERTPGRRAESLDCVIYAMVVRNLVNTNVDRRAEEVRAVTMPKRRATVAKSKWLEERT